MARVAIKPYLSPSLVLLALDWPEGKDRADFLGFAIRRTPGFGRAKESWLPNRIGFDGPAPPTGDLPSEQAPIQRFLWWDARIDEGDRGASLRYEAWPVLGAPGALRLLKGAGTQKTITLPHEVEDGIGTWFNRAVVSSQAFSRRFVDGKPLRGARLQEALDWLANGMQRVVPDFLADAGPVEGAIYHLTDEVWVMPAFEARTTPTSLVYDATDAGAAENEEALRTLKQQVELKPRTRAKIMHDKFLVRTKDGKGEALLTGSANFTTGGMTTQANVIHTLASPALAELYLARKRLLADDPTLGKTAQDSGWSKAVTIGDGKVRVFFPPEPTQQRVSTDTIVDAVAKAKSSVIFCIYATTDKPLRDACFAAADRGLMMFGLINKIVKPKDPTKPDAATVAKVETYNRSKKNKDVFGHAAFTEKAAKSGFWFEVNEIPGAKRQQFPVFVHHKFVVIDAETDAPTIYTGSANLSKSSLHENDENLLEIKGRTALAHAYLAEFMRLYEHYRARSRETDPKRPFALAPDAAWAKDDYTPGTPQFKSRVSMAS